MHVYEKFRESGVFPCTIALYWKCEAVKAVIPTSQWNCTSSGKGRNHELHALPWLLVLYKKR